MHKLINNTKSVLRIIVFTSIVIIAYNFLYQAGATTTGGYNGGVWNPPPNPPSQQPGAFPITTVKNFQTTVYQSKDGQLDIGNVDKVSTLFSKNIISNDFNAHNIGGANYSTSGITLNLASLGGIVDIGGPFTQNATFKKYNLVVKNSNSHGSYVIIRDFADSDNLDTDRKELCADINGYLEICSEPADIKLTSDYANFDVYGYALNTPYQIKGPKFTWSTTYNQSGVTPQGCNLYGGTLEWLMYNQNANTSGSTQRIEDIAGKDPGTITFGIQCTYNTSQNSTHTSKSEVPIYISQNSININSININPSSCSVEIDAEAIGINKHNPGAFTHLWYYRDSNNNTNYTITTGEFPFRPVFTVPIINYSRDITLTGELTRDSITKTFEKNITIPGSTSC